MQKTRNPGEFARLNGNLCRYYLASRVSVQDLEDVLQTFFLRLVEKPVLENYKSSKGSFDCYIYQALSWTVGDYYRTLKPTLALSEALECPQNASGRVSDFLRYISANAGVQKTKVLDLIKAKIRGDKLPGGLYTRRVYHKLVSSYLQAERG